VEEAVEGGGDQQAAQPKKKKGGGGGGFALASVPEIQSDTVLVPTLVKGTEGLAVNQISAGGFASAVVLRDGRVFTFGFAGNGLFLDTVALKRGIVNNPRPKELTALTAPRKANARMGTAATSGQEVLSVSIGMRHALAMTTHNGALSRELPALLAIEHLVERFSKAVESLERETALRVETKQALQQSFDKLLPDSIALLQPLLDDVCERGLRGHPVVSAGEDLERRVVELRQNIVDLRNSFFRRYVCFCLAWGHRKQPRPPVLQRRIKRAPPEVRATAKEVQRAVGDPNFDDGADLK
jgi:hypothetical protein